MPSIGAVPQVLENTIAVNIGEMLLAVVDGDEHKVGIRWRSGGVDDPLVRYAGRSLGELL